MSHATSANNNSKVAVAENDNRPATMKEMDDRDNVAWMYSAAAAMAPFTLFCFSHTKGVTVRAVEAMAKSPVGVYGLLALPFFTLAMEKSIYDTVQAWQGLDPNVRPKDGEGSPLAALHCHLLV